MAPIKDFAMRLLLMVLIVGPAAAILWFRDRCTLRPDMSPAERRDAIERNTARTLHWWHLIALIGIFTVLMLGVVKGRNLPSPIILELEVAIIAFMVFRYYRQRSEEVIKPVPRNNRSTPRS